MNTEDQATASEPAGKFEAFTFGEPTPVLESRGLLDYLECWRSGRYFEPPVDYQGLARTVQSNPYLQSGLKFKRNMLLRTFKPHRLLSRQHFAQLTLDFLTFGTAYVERVKAMSGAAHSLMVPLSLYVRRGTTEGEFFQVRAGGIEHEFTAGSVFQLREADVSQEIYGVPEWMPAVQSALLNESATLFRRKYYNNGSHAGFILYLTDSQVNKDDLDNLREQLKASRGVGNFRNLFLHSPNGKKEGIQLIPVSEVAAKDEFTGIKSVTRDDMLASLRVPPQLLGIVPQNSGGFGSIRDAAMVWAAMELEPLQSLFEPINEWVGERVISFDPFSLAAVAA